VARLIPILLVVLVVVLVASAFVGRRSTSTRVRSGRPRRSAHPSRYGYEKRSEQVKRRVKGIPAPNEKRTQIVGWLDSHEGVEAFVEPRTAISSLSVVLVDEVGEWRRFELRDDSTLRRLASERGFPVYDASKIGYPSRMRRRKGDPGEGSTPPS
jgi:hypothetical protein